MGADTPERHHARRRGRHREDASVAITGPDTVVVTLSAAPTGANPRLRYAFTGISGALGGPTAGPRGNLRDSDATPSPEGYKLFNWCVHFEAPAP